MVVWKTVIGFNYEVSNKGFVRNLKNKYVLKPQIQKAGYAYVFLCSPNGTKCKSIHRLVAEAFIPNIKNKEYINHIDGNKTNNDVKNLEWVTASENMYHAYNKLGIVPGFLNKEFSDLSKHKISIANSGAKNGRSRKIRCLDTGEIFDTITQAAHKYGLGVGNISSVCHGKLKTTGGKRWEYI